MSVARPEELACKQLVELLTEACRRWGSHPDTSTNVLSLSGGLDSRAVAVGMTRAQVPFVTATFLDHRGNASTDLRIAKQLAALLGVPSVVFELPAPSPAQVEALAYMKDGLNTVAMAATALAVAMFADCEPASAESTLHTVLQRKKLIVGTTYDSPPTGFLDAQGHVMGYAPDLARYLAKRLGVGLEFVQITAATRVPRGDDQTPRERRQARICSACSR